jgi:glutamate formiminotransferase/formiminotetrahydrofolate cyclodeaminase
LAPLKTEQGEGIERNRDSDDQKPGATRTPRASALNRPEPPTATDDQVVARSEPLERRLHCRDAIDGLNGIRRGHLMWSHGPWRDHRPTILVGRVPIPPPNRHRPALEARPESSHPARVRSGAAVPATQPTIGGMADPTSGSFRDVTLGAFVDELASAAPVPGGGSASAVAASLGAALVAMVSSLSEGRPKYAAHADLHYRSQAIGRRLAARFLNLADEDADAYADFAAAMKLPRDSETERTARKAALGLAAKRAAEVPLLIVEGSNTNASSDLDVATLLGEAAARGAAANVLINLPSVDDDSFSGEATAKVMALLTSIDEIVATVHAGVRSGATRDPLESTPA